MDATLPRNWEKCTIHDLIGRDGIFSDGDWVESKDQNPDGTVRLIQLADIGVGEFKDKSSRYLTVEKSAELGCTYLQKNDVLISRLPDPLGKCCLFPLDEKQTYVTAVDVSIVRLHKAIDPRWFVYFFNSLPVRDQVYQHQTGSTRKRISRKNIGRITLVVPPRNEQSRIVAKIEELFSELDKGVESLKTARAQLKTYRQSLLKAAFEGRLTEQWRHSAKQSGTLTSVAESLASIPEIPRPNRWKTRSKDVVYAHPCLAVGNPETPLPEGWEWVPLVDVARMESGHTPSRRRPEWWGGDIPWIGISDARANNGKVISETTQYTNAEGLQNSAARLLPKGTVCVSRTASVGYVVEMGCEMATSQDFVNWVPSDAVTSAWLRLVFGAHKEYLLRFSKGTTHRTIYFPEWLSVHIGLPSLKEQNRIVEEVEANLSQMDALEGVMGQSLNQSESLRHSILKRAFEGKLVPQDPNDEPASALLERIRQEQADAPKPRRRTRKARTTA